MKYSRLLRSGFYLSWLLDVPCEPSCMEMKFVDQICVYDDLMRIAAKFRPLALAFYDMQYDRLLVDQDLGRYLEILGR